MKVVIFCGGFGTRFNIDKNNVLKPLVKINGVSILKRIINLYTNYGYKEFILLGGYKFEMLEKFAKKQKKINVLALNTGLKTDTASRLLKAKKYIKGNFFLTYGDSLTDYNPISSIVKKNKIKNSFIISTYKYLLPYGILNCNNKEVKSFHEKNTYININAGFYLLDENIFQFIGNKNESFEKETLLKIIKNKKYKLVHNFVNFWHPMDTLSDKKKLSLVLKNKKYN